MLQTLSSLMAPEIVVMRNAVNATDDKVGNRDHSLLSLPDDTWPNENVTMTCLLRRSYALASGISYEIGSSAVFFYCANITFLGGFEWWCHEMEALSALLALFIGKSTGHCWIPPGIGGFPSQRANNVVFDEFFDVSLSSLLNKQMGG